MPTRRFPSKTFLLGEYAILKGASALLLGHAPHFSCTQEYSSSSDSLFHPESPAGKWLRSNPVEAKIRFQDPHSGAGGFGGSGAEFLSAWSVDREIPSLENPRAIFAWSAWEDSRAFPGSGADILLQAFGVDRADPFFLEIDLVGRTLHEIFPANRGTAEISLFHTGKKLATHEISVPENLPVEEMEEMVFRASQALESGNATAFGKEVNAYGEKLASLGLLAPHSSKALEEIRGKQGILGAKGCGAMGADVLLVVHQGGNWDKWAEENSLAHVGSFPV